VSDPVDAQTDHRARAESLVADLEAAADAYEQARDRVAEIGERDLQDLADAYDDLLDLLDRYDDRATTDGDFADYIEFQDRMAHFTEDLPEDLRKRSLFEDVDEALHKRRLKPSDFEQARTTLQPVADLVARLDERETARQRYRDARHDLNVRRRDLDERIDDLERLQHLGAADLDAPTERLRDPIETYNAAVAEAFDAFKHDASARRVLRFVASTGEYPLVPFQPVPEDLEAFVEDAAVGTEPIRTLLEYAEYSPSKLDHYVDQPRRLKRAVATQQTYLTRLDATPLQLEWPPRRAETVRWRTQELITVVDRFADEDVVATLRRVRELTWDDDYARLRESAVAAERLDAEERERLERGAVADELADARDARELITDALDAYPDA
jgi:hypothetical protein